MTITKGSKYITDPNTIPIDTNFASDVLPTLLDTLDTNTTDHINSVSAHSSSDITYDNTSSGLTATNTKDALDEIDVNNETTQSQLDTHEGSTNAHASVDITYDNTTSGLTATDVKNALDEVKSNNDSAQTQLDNHEASSSAHEASSITYDNATSGLTASDAKSAIDEIDSNLDSHLSSTTAHDASDIVYDNTSSGLVATTSQAAIDEIEGRVDTVESGKVDSGSEASLLNTAREETTTATTGSLDLDVSTASSFLVDVIGTIDITLSGTTTDKTHQVYVEALNSGGSLSWTTSITWDAGTEPTLGTNFTIYYLVYIGGTWYGKAIISN